MKSIIISTILFLILFSVNAYAGLDQNITVQSIAGCTEELDPGEGPKVKSKKWDGSKLVIIVLANRSRGPYQPISPSYNLSGNQLTINWAWHLPPKSDIAACLCTRHLKFTISELPKKKYNIVISEDANKVKRD
jgi:hypothetical protein